MKKTVKEMDYQVFVAYFFGVWHDIYPHRRRDAIGMNSFLFVYLFFKLVKVLLPFTHLHEKSMSPIQAYLTSSIRWTTMQEVVSVYFIAGYWCFVFGTILR